MKNLFQKGMRIAMVMAVMAAAAGVLATAPAGAQDYPNKRLSLVVSFPPGGGGDALARVVADNLSKKEYLGQPVILDYKPGAATYIGHDFATKAAPDGYTLLLATQALSAPKELFAVESFDPSKLVSAGRIAGSPYLLLVPAELPQRTLAELIQYAKANPDKLNFGVVPSSAMLMDFITFQNVTGAKLTEIPFNGGAPIVAALLGNQIQMAFLSVSAMPQVQAGKLRALAVAARSRWARMPDVPTTAELGVSFESSFWYGLAAPTGTPAPVIAKLGRDLQSMLKQAPVRELIFKLGFDTIESSPEEMAQQIERERKLNEAAVKAKPGAFKK